MILILAPGTAIPPQGEEKWWAFSAGLCFPHEAGKRERSPSVLISQEPGSHMLSVQLDARPHWSLSSLTEVSLVLHVGLWLQSYLQGDAGQGMQGGESCRGTATSGRQKGVSVLGGAPFFLSGVHGGPTVSRPQDCSAEQVDRPQTGPCLFRL